MIPQKLRVPVAILMVCILGMSLLYFVVLGNKLSHNSANVIQQGSQTNNNDSNTAKQKTQVSELSENQILDKIQIKKFSIQKTHMDFAGEEKQGFRFMLIFTMPGTNDHGKANYKIGIQVVYPKEYFDALGTDGSGIFYINQGSAYTKEMDTTFEAYPSDISAEQLNKMLNTQYDFKICIYDDQMKGKEVYIQNAKLKS